MQVKFLPRLPCITIVFNTAATISIACTALAPYLRILSHGVMITVANGTSFLTDRCGDIPIRLYPTRLVPSPIRTPTRWLSSHCGPTTRSSRAIPTNPLFPNSTTHPPSLHYAPSYATRAPTPTSTAPNPKIHRSHDTSNPLPAPYNATTSPAGL